MGRQRQGLQQPLSLSQWCQGLALEREMGLAQRCAVGITIENNKACGAIIHDSANMIRKWELKSLVRNRNHTYPQKGEGHSARYEIEGRGPLLAGVSDRHGAVPGEDVPPAEAV